MPRNNISSRTGNASIKKQGHTSSGQFGSDPNMKPKGRGAVRELKSK